MALQDNTLLIIILAPAGSDTHLKIADNAEPSRLSRVIRQECNIRISTISGGRISVTHAKQILEHINRRGRPILILTIIPILNNHNTKRDREGAR